MRLACQQLTVRWPTNFLVIVVTIRQVIKVHGRGRGFGVYRKQGGGLVTGSEEEPQTEVAGVPLPTRLLDGYEVHRAALARGLEVLALPRQVLLAGDPTAVPAQVSFTHGVPEASGLSAVTFAQDQRLRRALLEKARIPKPEGASFSWRSISKAQRWAREKGYPVVIREGVGENPPRAIHHITSDEELRDAFAKLRRRDAADRTPGSNPYIAGYATTRLTFTHDEGGNEVAPLRSRMLIEKDVPGQGLRAFVIGDQVIAAVELDEDRMIGVREVTSELRTKFKDVFLRSARAVPGLGGATVDAVNDNSPDVDRTRDFLVTGIAERPRTESYITANPELGVRIGDAILDFQARQAGLELGAAADTVNRELEIEGLRDADGVAAQLPQLAMHHGVSIEVTRVDSITGDIDATATGSPSVMAALVELLMAGCLFDDKAAAVNYSKGASRA